MKIFYTQRKLRKYESKEISVPAIDPSKKKKQRKGSDYLFVLVFETLILLII